LVKSGVGYRCGPVESFESIFQLERLWQKGLLLPIFWSGLGYTLPTSTMRRLITMLAYVNGDLLNASNSQAGYQE
jgi:hypothetical protein